jgi:hypothetical protein
VEELLADLADIAAQGPKELSTTSKVITTLGWVACGFALLTA